MSLPKRSVLISTIRILYTEEFSNVSYNTSFTVGGERQFYNVSREPCLAYHSGQSRVSRWGRGSFPRNCIGQGWTQVVGQTGSWRQCCFGLTLWHVISVSGTCVRKVKTQRSPAMKWSYEHTAFWEKWSKRTCRISQQTQGTGATPSPLTLWAHTRCLTVSGGLVPPADARVACPVVVRPQWSVSL